MKTCGGSAPVSPVELRSPHSQRGFRRSLESDLELDRILQGNACTALFPCEDAAGRNASAAEQIKSGHRRRASLVSDTACATPLSTSITKMTSNLKAEYHVANESNGGFRTSTSLTPTGNALLLGETKSDLRQDSSLKNGPSQPSVSSKNRSRLSPDRARDIKVPKLPLSGNESMHQERPRTNSSLISAKHGTLISQSFGKPFLESETTFKDPSPPRSPIRPSSLSPRRSFIRSTDRRLEASSTTRPQSDIPESLQPAISRTRSVDSAVGCKANQRISIDVAQKNQRILGPPSSPSHVSRLSSNRKLMEEKQLERELEDDVVEEFKNQWLTELFYS